MTFPLSGPLSPASLQNTELDRTMAKGYARICVRCNINKLLTRHETI
jgi:hypothetical protein